MAKRSKKRFRIYEGNVLLVTLFRLMVVMLVFDLARVCFYLFNLHYFSDLSVSELIRLFFIGFRFDISALCIINAPIILLNSLPFRFRYNRVYQTFVRVLFYIINIAALFVDFVDLIYFRFTLKRLTADIFSYLSVGGEFNKLIPQFIHDFWYVPLVWGSLCILLVFLTCRFWVVAPRGKSKLNPVQYFLLHSFYFALILFVTILGIRGGTQLRPIGIITAGNYTNAKNVPLVLNTPFSIARTFGNESLKTIVDYKKEDDLEKVFTPLHKPHDDHFRNLNVVIIIMESFSKEHIGSMNPGLENGNYKGYTPFLDSLSRYSLVMNGFANGKTSIQGIPAVLSGIPSLMNVSFIQSNYSTDKMNSLASLLKEKGYKSAFFHGGTNGTMGFDSYTRIAGFDQYYGRSEYNNEKDYDGKWGIRDEEFFQYTKNIIDHFSQPFLVGFFSLSSHHPYVVPSKYTYRFRKGNLPIQESIMYADYSLGKFFKAAENSPWYQNTLFVITADHTSEGYYPFYQTDAGQFSVPILFFRPGVKLEARNSEIAAQTDIMPSVLDYLNFDKDYIAFGNSVFDTSAAHFSVHYISGVYGMIKDGYLLEYNGTRSTALFDLATDSLQKQNLIKQDLPIEKGLEDFLKAYLQQYTNRLIENRLSAE
jgi:phosphoglycerol transferase MdoB-like AlkP superfamily enzyme